MVDPTKFDSVRIVQDLSLEEGPDPHPKKAGTKVFSDVLEATLDSLFPLQGALGYEITQSLFVGPNSLVVEGVADLLFLQGMSFLLEEQGREGLSKDWTVTPVGGSDKVPDLCGSPWGATAIERGSSSRLSKERQADD